VFRGWLSTGLGVARCWLGGGSIVVGGWPNVGPRVARYWLGSGSI
jgi:hypothetical protein